MTNKELYSDYKWIKVKRYTMDESKSWEERYKDLDDHHLKETTFLINEVRSLAEKLDTTSASESKLKKDEQRSAYLNTFFIFWFGFAMILGMIVDSLLDKQIQRQYDPWILIGIVLFGLICSSTLTYFKWKKEKNSLQ